MFRHPRETEPDDFSVELNTVLQPLPVIPWGEIAMGYLGVPIVIGDPMIVVRDDDYTVATEKLRSAGFIQTVPNRNPAPEIMERHPNPQQMLEEINAGYKRFDRSCTVFDYPPGYSAGNDAQLYLFPNSFAHFSPQDSQQFDTYVDEEKDAGFSTWVSELKAWISMMAGYLEVNNDILDHCPDEQAVEWYSTNFGRIYEDKFGPMDRRISKRLGSGKEMPIDMRGNPI